ncbi:hypothetical protein R6Q59_022809 [Mikania micrantha]
MGQGTPEGFNRQGNPTIGRTTATKKYKKFEPDITTGKASARLPTVTPHSKCRLRLLKVERIKDYLLMEEEFVVNQERLKPQEEKTEEDRSKVFVSKHFVRKCNYFYKI